VVGPHVFEFTPSSQPTRGGNTYTGPGIPGGNPYTVPGIPEAAGHPDAARRLLEGLEEMFTINRLELSPSLLRCLSTTNIIESPNSRVRSRTRRVSRWRDGNMVLRWVAAAFLETEKRYRKIMGHRDRWMLQAQLGREATFDKKERVA
jgi:hypothetical protein